MASKNHAVTVMMENHMHFDLNIIAFAQKYGLGIKDASMSKIVNQALKEYFVNHKDEVDAAMDEYRNRGAWIDR